MDRRNRSRVRIQDKSGHSSYGRMRPPDAEPRPEPARAAPGHELQPAAETACAAVVGGVVAAVGVVVVVVSPCVI